MSRFRHLRDNRLSNSLSFGPLIFQYVPNILQCLIYWYLGVLRILVKHIKSRSQLLLFECKVERIPNLAEVEDRQDIGLVSAVFDLFCSIRALGK
jgi:hypothetical protein